MFTKHLLQVDHGKYVVTLKGIIGIKDNTNILHTCMLSRSSHVQL